MTVDRAAERASAATALANYAEKIAVAEAQRDALERKRGRYCARLAEKMSLREIAELAGVASHNTVKAWIERSAEDGA